MKGQECFWPRLQGLAAENRSELLYCVGGRIGPDVAQNRYLVEHSGVWHVAQECAQNRNHLFECSRGVAYSRSVFAINWRAILSILRRGVGFQQAVGSGRSYLGTRRAMFLGVERVPFRSRLQKTHEPAVYRQIPSPASAHGGRGLWVQHARLVLHR